MIEIITGIDTIQKLYLELLYACNFNCHHCFHGDNLKLKEQFDLEAAKKLISLFKLKYRTTSITLLGGEPFLYKDLVDVVRFAKQLDLKVEICTNGYKISKFLQRIAPDIDHLRVAIDGLEETHDRLRKHGSFKEAIETLIFANNLNIRTSVTLTINRLNITEVIPLAYKVKMYKVEYIKLHCLRKVGNVLKFPYLIIDDNEVYRKLCIEIKDHYKSIGMPILYDRDLELTCFTDIHDTPQFIQEELSRVEVQPDGALYISCKAVGKGCNAFYFDKISGDIKYEPQMNDEFRLNIEQVRYSSFQ